MIIQLKNISKVIKSNVILQNINMTLESGQIYGFVGSNGSGKTMLMRILTGLVNYSSGDLLVDNKKVKPCKDIYYEMGVIIEKPEFFNDLTGLENLQILAKLKNIITDQEIIDSMNRVGLDPYNHKKVKQYSLGMRQRLGIAQAIMENPDVLILDEVTSALDEDGVEMTRNVLKQERDKGKLIIISSHNASDIEMLCDTIYRIRNQTIA
jgi:ABC-2 type transport system ATP-binding protein